MEHNAKLAQLLHQIAALLDEQGIQFKPAAYRKAAKTVEEYAGDICSLKDVKELRKLPGVGEAIANKVLEFCSTGRIKHLDDLMAEQGGLSPSLMEIEGLGPKRVRILQRDKGISTIPQLIEAAKEGKLKGLPGFSDVMEKKILENAGRVDERMKRFPREEIKDDAETVLHTIREVKGVERAEIAGSYRREKSTVGDIDILVVTPLRAPRSAGQASSSQEVSNTIAKLPMVRDVVAHGDTKLSFNFTSGLRVDVRFVSKDQWGSALLYFTGDKDHNIALRRIAIKNGWKLSEYGLFEGEKVIASKEEKDIYEKLGLPWIEPTQRTGMLPDILPF